MNHEALYPWLSTLPPLAKYPPTGWQITPLQGLSNRSYRLQQADQDLWLRLPGRDTSGFVDRQAEAHNIALAAQLGLCPPLLYESPQEGILVSPFLRDARPLSPTDLRDEAILARAVELLSNLHRSRAPLRGRVILGETLRHYRQRLGTVPRDVAYLLNASAPLLNTLDRHCPPLVPCHLDPHPGNFLLTRDGHLYLVDWEYSAMGDPLWDLATLAGEGELESGELSTLFSQHAGVSPGELHRLWLYRGALDLLALLWWYAYHPEQHQASYPQTRLRRLKMLLSSPDLAVHLHACATLY